MTGLNLGIVGIGRKVNVGHVNAGVVCGCHLAEGGGGQGHFPLHLLLIAEFGLAHLICFRMQLLV